MIASKASDHIAMSTAAKGVIEQMGANNNFTVDYTTDTSLISEANLAKYDVFFQCHLAPFEFSVSKRAGFEKFVESGKGWVGIHAAGLTGTQFTGSSWAWYQTFFGDITWVVHPALQTGTILFEDRTHPVTKNMPASFQLKDEWYEWNKNPRPNVRVLGKADETSYHQVKPQGDHPMIWTNETYRKMVYIGIGHDVSDWSNPNYVLLIHDALMWAKPAATRLDPGATEKGYLGSPKAARAWMKDGMIFVDPGAAPGATGDRARESIRILDLSGRDLSMQGLDAFRFHRLAAPAP